MDVYVVASLTVAVIATVFSAVQTAFVRRDSIDRRRMEQLDFVRSFERELGEFTDVLHATLGGPQDDLPHDVRRVAVRLLVLYSQVYLAHRDDLFRRGSWEGLRSELAYWLARPQAQRAWRHLRAQEGHWPDGFVAFVDGELERAPSVGEPKASTV